MKRSSFFYLLVAIVATLLLTGIGGYYALVQQSPLNLLGGGSQATPVATMFVPKQAPVMVSTLVNPDRLEALRQAVAPPKERRRSRTELNQLKTNLLANTGVDYRRDIQPWLGDEITVSVTNLDVDRNGENGQQPGYLMAIATKDATKSREFLQLLFSKRALAGTDSVFEQYKGVKLIYDNPTRVSSQENIPDLSPSLTGAVVGDRFMLFANYPKVLRDAINNVQAPDLNLSSSSQYQQALTLLPPRRLGFTFLNLPYLGTWKGLEPEVQTYQSQIIALELNRQGLLAETALLAAPDRENSPPAPALSQTVGALDYIPATTGFSISGFDLSRLKNSNLHQLWTQVSAALFNSDEVTAPFSANSQRRSTSDDIISRLVNQPLKELQAQWGIDLSQDIFNWVQGEYALGLLPHTDSTNPDWVFVCEKSAADVQGISHLDAIASAQGLSITPLPLKNQKVYAWTELITAPTKSPNEPDRASLTLKAKVQGVHTTVGKYEIFTNSVEAMDAALNAPQIGSLVDNPQFKTGISAIPQPNQGYIYLDWTASQRILERQLPILKLLEITGKPVFNNLRSLTISSYGNEPGLLKGGVFFRFNNSPPLR